MDCLDDGRRQGNHGLSINNVGPLTPDVGLEGRVAPNQPEKLPRSSFRVLSGHDGADYGNAIEWLLFSGALEEDALQVGLVDSSDAHGLRGVASVGYARQDVPHASGANDFLGVCLPVLCQSPENP